MTQSTPPASASSAPTKSFEKVFGETGAATSRTRCQVFAFEAYTAPPPKAPVKHSSISQLAAEWEQDAECRAVLEEGRQWLADTFYGEDGDTVRTLRLRKGWSQARLAEALATSQPHVARIERGTENLTIETCRKLSRALDIDLNTLDQALKRQEAIAQAKQK
jgi:ribosome-binding protein aMBF1 (putative translation factor)